MSEATETDLQPTDTTEATSAAAAPDDTRVDDTDAVNALRALPPRLFARMCRRIPLRPFLAELEKLDRSSFYRYFKGLRPQKIDGPYLEKVFHKELREKSNGLLAQLVIYNWDEAESRLYGDMQEEVKKINEDVEAIVHITDEQGNAIVDALEPMFDPRDIYIGFVINGVRVAPAFYAARFPTLAPVA